MVLDLTGHSSMTLHAMILKKHVAQLRRAEVASTWKALQVAACSRSAPPGRVSRSAQSSRSPIHEFSSLPDLPVPIGSLPIVSMVRSRLRTSVVLRVRFRRELRCWPGFRPTKSTT